MVDGHDDRCRRLKVTRYVRVHSQFGRGTTEVVDLPRGLAVAKRREGDKARKRREQMHLVVDSSVSMEDQPTSDLAL